MQTTLDCTQRERSSINGFSLFFTFAIMAHKLVFATNNAHKLLEIRKIIPGNFEILGLQDIGCTEDIPETATTLEGNADLKAFFVFNKFGKGCFADDTGLEVEALNGEPGVYSARYAGEEGDAEKNITKLLHKLQGQRTGRQGSAQSSPCSSMEKPYISKALLKG